MALDAQQISTLGILIDAEDAEHNCEIPSIHLVPLAIRRYAVEV